MCWAWSAPTKSLFAEHTPVSTIALPHLTTARLRRDTTQTLQPPHMTYVSEWIHLFRERLDQATFASRNVMCFDLLDSLTLN